MLHPDAPIKILGDVLIAAENRPRHRNFPNTVLLQNGDLLVVYGVSAERRPWWFTDHQQTSEGVLVSRRSSDGGETWSDPLPVLAYPGHHYSSTYGMIQLTDGRIMLHVWEWRFRKPEDGPGYLTHHRHKVVRILRMFSEDNGLYMDGASDRNAAPSLPHVRVAIRPPPRARGRPDHDAHVRPSAGGRGDRRPPNQAVPRGVVGHGGRLLLRRRAHLPRIDRDGLEQGRAPDVQRDGRVASPDGRFMAILREGTAPKWSHRSYSSDEGRTWTPYEQVNFKGECPCLVQLRSGAILCAYRDLEGNTDDNPDGNRPGISVSISEDDGETWRWVGQLYSGPNKDCGYPVIVRLADGRLFCTYYTSFADGDCEVRGMWLSDDI